MALMKSFNVLLGKQNDNGLLEIRITQPGKSFIATAKRPFPGSTAPTVS